MGGRFLKIEYKIRIQQNYRQLKIIFGEIQFLSVNSDFVSHFILTQNQH